jgi:cytochrome c556
MKKSARLVLGAAVALAFVSVAQAQAPRPDRAIKYRQGVMGAQSWNMGPLAAMVKGDRPYDKDLFLRHATRVEQLLAMPWEAFGPGTDTGAPTKAKPEIWKEPAKFKQHQEQTMAAAAKLVAAARVGTLDAVKGPFGDLGNSCNNCHDDFRSK